MTLELLLIGLLLAAPLVCLIVSAKRESRRMAKLRKEADIKRWKGLD